MSNLRVLVWLAVGAAVIAAGWLLIAPRLVHVQTDWRYAVGNPVLIGSPDDPFAYAGGDSIRPVDGSGTLRLSTDRRGTLRLSIELPDPGSLLLLQGSTNTGRAWSLVSTIDASSELWFETAFHGDSGAGDPRLPETTARIAGRSLFDLTVDGNRQLTDVVGVWSIADALRQDDGSIRQQGLVFSPLLRDKSGFTDPKRLELTVLLYEDGPGSNVLADVVFRDVVLEGEPTGP